MLKSQIYVFILFLIQDWAVAQVNFSQKSVAHYPFLGIAKDAFLTINKETVNGSVLTPNRFGSSNSAYCFIESNAIERNASKIAAIEFSYSAWVYLSALPGSGTGATIFAKESLGGDSFYGLFRNFYGLSGFMMFSYSALFSTGIRIVSTFESTGHGH